MWMDRLLEKDRLPDFLVRMGIRQLLKGRLADLPQEVEQRTAYMQDYIQSLKQQPIAVHTEDANEQHYEVPTSFFQLVLGKHLKYSCGYWGQDIPLAQAHTQLDHSEEEMLRLTCERADVQDGHTILELGCGWGSLSLYMAERYPASKITVVSNSATQKEYIDARIHERGLSNLQVVTADMNEFITSEAFDRVVSVEMFEHMRNYQLLLERVASFLKPEGILFVHIFTHRSTPYLFEERSETDWMAKYFFTGGMMPSQDLYHYFTTDVSLEQQWSVSGKHYQKTCEAWLQRMDQQRVAIMPLFRQTYGEENAIKWWAYWRIFFMACAEIFGYKEGNEWFVSHYRFRKR